MPDSNDIVFDSYGPDIIGGITNLITGAAESGGGFSGLSQWLLRAWEIYSIIAFIVSAILIVGIIYAYIRFNQLSEIEVQNIAEAERMWKELYGENAGNSQWNQIQSHLDSESPNDWKLAIIEADIMLDKTLTDAGYAGTSVGEKLKSASPQSMTTIRDAWDAHMIRNKIAHQGSDFVLTKRTARETITKYQRVFQEFGVM